MKVVMPSDAALHYSGRIERKNMNTPAFYWAGSSVSFGFSGDTLSLCIENFSKYNVPKLGYLLDGVEYQFLLSEDSGFPVEYPIPVPCGGRHTFTLWKRQDDPHYFILRGISVGDSDEVFSTYREKNLKLEFYGDSVTAGAVCEAVDRVGQEDPPVYDSTLDNAWQSYAMQTARLLDAEVHLVAQGGIALLDGTGYYEYGKYGMESAYDRLCYLSNAPSMTAWDFSKYQPDFVIFAIGQNDHRVGDTDISEFTPEARTHWLKVYTDMLNDLLEKYPSARFLLMLTILGHDEYWEQLLDEACAMLDNPRVTRFRFKRSGCGTPGHPRVQEHQEMACELSEHLHKMLCEDR